MTVVDVLPGVLLVVGCAFYFAATVGLLRFPDTMSRIHALTKADNLGLFFVCASIALRADSLRIVTLLVVVWLLGILASTVSAHLIAGAAYGAHEAPGADGEAP